MAVLRASQVCNMYADRIGAGMPARESGDMYWSQGTAVAARVATGCVVEATLCAPIKRCHSKARSGSALLALAGLPKARGLPR